MTATLPVALHLENRHCLVVGSGDEAARRAEQLAEAGALVTVIGAEPTTAMDFARVHPNIELSRRAFAESDLDDVWLVVQTDRDPLLADQLSALCEARHVLFCATDDPRHNSFSHLAIARAGFVKIAIGTDGYAPALARRLREELQRLLDASRLGAFAARLADLRARTPSSLRARVLNEAVSELRFDGELVIPES